MRVVSLHRFPVKSMLGEDLAGLDLDARGVVGDRAWSVRTPDNKIGSGKTTRRFAAVPGLLQLRASYDGDCVRVRLPDGDEVAVDDVETARRLSAYLSQPVTLARETDVSHFDDGPVSLVAMASVDAVGAEAGHVIDPARFRANVVLEGLPAFGEDALVGQRVRVGSALLEVTMRSPRCVMIDMESADLPAAHGNLLATGRANGACIGVIACVVEPGRISRGDTVVTAGASGARIRFGEVPQDGDAVDRSVVDHNLGDVDDLPVSGARDSLEQAPRRVLLQPVALHQRAQSAADPGPGGEGAGGGGPSSAAVSPPF